MANGALEPVKNSQWGKGPARHLLNRAGFGVPQSRVNLLAKQGPKEAVASLVDYESLPFDFRVPDDDVSVEKWKKMEAISKELDEKERRKYRNDYEHEEKKVHGRLKAWWMERMVRSPRPLEEKMSLFWHGHFATSAQKVKWSWATLELNEIFREHATGNFKHLTTKVGQSASMLYYLDNNRNEKAAPNENWARELMELFTMGQGNYSERDIKESARAFTGWTVSQGRFGFREKVHDYDSKTFLGKRGDFDGWDILDIIFRQDVTAEFICAKLWTFFAYPDPDPEIVGGLADTFRRHHYELKPLLSQMFSSRAFYSHRAVGTQIKSPIQLVIQMADHLGLEPVPYAAMTRAAAEIGQDLFYPPSVKGWDGGRAWINSNTLMRRYDMAKRLALASYDHDAPEDVEMTMAMNAGDGFELPARVTEFLKQLPEPRQEKMRRRFDDAESDKARRSLVRRFLRSRPMRMAWDPRPLFRNFEYKTNQECVEELEGYFLNVTLSREQRQVLIDALGGKISKQKMIEVLHLLVSTAEYQLC